MSRLRLTTQAKARAQFSYASTLNLKLNILNADVKGINKMMLETLILTNSLDSVRFESVDTDNYEELLSLKLQINRKVNDPVINKAAIWIIDNLEDNGYFDDSLLEGFSNSAREIFNQALLAVQTLEPHGVGARNVRECLLLQISNLDSDFEIEKKIISEFTSELSNRNGLEYISKTMNIAIDRIKDALKRIASLRPYPFQPKENELGGYILPDFSVQLVGQEIYVQPRNNFALKNIGPNGNSSDNKKLSAIIKYVEERNITLEKIIRIICQEQLEFINRYNSQPKHIPLSFITNQIGYSLSTVSRAINSKYIEINKEIYKLSDLTTGGRLVKREQALNLIKKIIFSESFSSRLSDEVVKLKLEEQGIQISRRTVAHYRKILGVSSSYERSKS